MIRAAWIVAFLIAGVMAVSAAHYPILLPAAVVPLVAGIGILRRRAWSAYGFALYQAMPLLLVPLLVARGGTALVWEPAMVTGLVLVVGEVVLFGLAGRALAREGVRGWRWGWITLSALVVVMGVCVQAFVISVGSMEDTMLVGDKILVQRWPKPAVEHGAIIVFRYPVDPKQTFTKRVVGMPGDRVAVRDKQLCVNGVAVKEPYARHKTDYMDSYRDNFPGEPNMRMAAQGMEMLGKHVRDGAVVVPAGKYFVMGDNRDMSFDSRYWGFVPAENVMGRPLVVYASEDEAGRVRWARIFKRF